MVELLLRLVFSLALVVGLLMLVARFAGRRFQGRAGATIRVVHRQPIGKGTGVAVVAVGTRVLVLGTTEHQVSLLTEVEPDEIGLDESELADLDLAALEPGADVEGLELEGPLSSENLTGEPVSPRKVSVSDLLPAGTVLSPQTWRQAYQAATRIALRRAS